MTAEAEAEPDNRFRDRLARELFRKFGPSEQPYPQEDARWLAEADDNILFHQEHWLRQTVSDLDKTS